MDIKITTIGRTINLEALTLAGSAFLGNSDMVQSGARRYRVILLPSKPLNDAVKQIVLCAGWDGIKVEVVS